MQSRSSKISTGNHLKLHECHTKPPSKKNVLNPLTNNPYYREVMSYLCTTDIISKTSVLTKWNYSVLLLDVSMNKIINDLIEKEFGIYLFESGRDILRRVEHYYQIQKDGSPWLATNTNDDYNKSKRPLVAILNNISTVLEKRNQYEKVYYLYNFFTNHKLRRYSKRKCNKNKTNYKNKKNGRKVILSLSSDILKENGIVEDIKSHQPFTPRQLNDNSQNLNTATKRTIIKCLFISMYKSINDYKNNNNTSKNYGIAFDKYVSLYNNNCVEEEKFVFTQMEYFQWSYGVIDGNSHHNNNNHNNQISSDKVYVYGVDDQDQKNWAYCTKSLIQSYLSHYLIQKSNQFYRQFLKQFVESCLSLDQFGCYKILNPNIILGELLLDLITYTLDNHFNRWINDDDDESESDNDDDFNFDFCDKTTDYLSIYGNNFVTDIASFAKFENKYYQFKETVQETLQKSKSGELKLKLETADILIIKMDLIKCNFDTIHNKWHQFFDSIFEAFETQDDVKKMQKDMRNDIKSVLEFEDFFSRYDVDDIEYINRYLPKDIQPIY